MSKICAFASESVELTETSLLRFPQLFYLRVEAREFA